MKITKFRAWDGKKMYFKKDGTCFNDSEGCFPDEIIEITHFNYGWEWMQSTQLKDKNGVDIYEGDIIKCLVLDYYQYKDEKEKLEHPKYYICKVDDIGSLHVLFSETNWDGYPCYSSENCEVIGNIYQNPELIKE